MIRNKHFDYETRLSRKDDILDWGYGCMDFAWTSELAGPEGAHYHVWLRRGLSKDDEQKHLREFKRAATRMGDPVSFSWDYIPKGET